MVEISRAIPADTASLGHFARRTFLDAYGGKDPSANVLQHVAEELTDEAIARDQHDPDTTFLLARGDNGNILGYVKLRSNRPTDDLPDPAAMQLERIYVDGTRHSGGIGSRLLLAALEAASQQRASALWLSVWKENQRAQAFYERNGFSRIGETFFMMGPEREEDYVFARHLT